LAITSEFTPVTMVSGMPPLYFRDRSTAERGKITVFSLSFNVATGKKLGSGASV
jgi:hypothetical protein